MQVCKQHRFLTEENSDFDQCLVQQCQMSVGWEIWILLRQCTQSKNGCFLHPIFRASWYFSDVFVYRNVSFYKKGAPLPAVATGVAVLKVLRIAKAEVGLTLRKNSVKFHVRKEEEKSK